MRMSSLIQQRQRCGTGLGYNESIYAFEPVWYSCHQQGKPGKQEFVFPRVSNDSGTSFRSSRSELAVLLWILPNKRETTTKAAHRGMQMLFCHAMLGGLVREKLSSTEKVSGQMPLTSQGLMCLGLPCSEREVPGAQGFPAA